MTLCSRVPTRLLRPCMSGSEGVAETTESARLVRVGCSSWPHESKLHIMSDFIRPLVGVVAEMDGCRCHVVVYLCCWSTSHGHRRFGVGHH